MNEVERLRYIDFLSIGLQQIEAENYDIAEEFIDDVRVNLLNGGKEDLSHALQHSINKIDEGEYEEAETFAEGVCEELMEDG